MLTYIRLFENGHGQVKLRKKRWNNVSCC